MRCMWHHCNTQDGCFSKILTTDWLAFRADSRFAPIQWETSLQSNGVSHWLGANLESALALWVTMLMMGQKVIIKKYGHNELLMAHKTKGWCCESMPYAGVIFDQVMCKPCVYWIISPINMCIPVGSRPTMWLPLSQTPDTPVPLMIMSSNGNVFRVTGPLWGESTGHRCIPLTKASDAVLLCFLWSAPEQTVE